MIRNSTSKQKTSVLMMTANICIIEMNKTYCVVSKILMNVLGTYSQIMLI